MSRYNEALLSIIQPTSAIVLLITVCVFLLRSASFAWKDGSQLLADCGASDAIKEGRGQSFDAKKFLDAGRRTGFIQGIVDMNTFYQAALKDAALFCSPNNSTYGQALRIVVKYLRDHPEQLHKDEFDLAVAALSAVFPCTNKK